MAFITSPLTGWLTGGEGPGGALSPQLQGDCIGDGWGDRTLPWATPAVTSLQYGGF